MKIQIAIAAAVLALASSITANAQTSAFTVDVSPTPQTWTGAALTFGGSITNTTGSSLDISTDSVSVPSSVGYTDEFGANLFNNGDLILAPGATYGPVSDLFTITGPVASSFTGTFSATDFSTSVPITGFGDFQVIVPGATTPEPGSLALLASSVLGGGLFLRRRRK